MGEGCRKVKEVLEKHKLSNNPPIKIMHTQILPASFRGNDVRLSADLAYSSAIRLGLRGRQFSSDLALSDPLG